MAVYAAFYTCYPVSLHHGINRQGEECPQTFFTGKFLLTYQEKGGNKGKWRRKEGKVERQEVENW